MFLKYQKLIRFFSKCRPILNGLDCKIVKLAKSQKYEEISLHSQTYNVAVSTVVFPHEKMQAATKLHKKRDRNMSNFSQFFLCVQKKSRKLRLESGLKC